MITLARPSAPSTDKRWKLIDATMRRNGYKPSALIETLHTAQESYGYLSDEAISYIARSLHVPLSKAYGAASFYHYFNFKPAGKHTCVVCTGTACYIKGSSNLLSAMKEFYGLDVGQTTSDGEVSLLTARCVGSCGLAPAVVLDGNVAPKATPRELVDLVTEAMQS